MKITWYDAAGDEHVLHDRLAMLVGKTPTVNPSCEIQAVRVAGTGMPTPQDITEEGPYQHGESWLYGLLTERIFRLGLKLNNIGGATDQDALVRGLSEVCRWFNPHSESAYGLGRMRFETNGALREIVCRYHDGLKMDITEADVTEIMDEVVLYAPDPLFYDPTQRTTAFTYSNVLQLVFPFTFPFVLGSSTINKSQNVTISGHWEVFPIIVIDGPADSVLIKNNTTGKLIDLQYAIAIGEAVTIDLAYGAKTVVNNFGDRLNTYLDPSTDITGWSLAVPPVAAGGVNSIYVFAPNASNDTAVTFYWNDKYLSI